MANLLSETRRSNSDSNPVGIQLVTEAINTLNSRIERTERDFVGHLQKVEDRLDQIVDLTKTVAALQQTSANQNDQILEIRSQLRENAQKIDNSISRIHTRLDEITSHQRDKLELYAKEIELKLTNVEEKHINNVEIFKGKTENNFSQLKQDLKAEFVPVKNKSDYTEAELKKWLNRGWGVWTLAVIIFGTVQTVAFRWVGSLEEERVKLVTSVNALNSITEKQTYLLEGTKKELTDVTSSLKRLEQMVIDNERQLEYVRTQAREKGK